MNKKLILSGIHIGEHSLDTENITREIKERCVDLGLNYLTVRVCDFCVPFNPKENKSDELALYNIAKCCKDYGIYFTFQYSLKDTYIKPVSRFTKEMVDRIKDIAGEYFLGDCFAEMAEFYTIKTEGYRESEGFAKTGDVDGPPKNLTDIRDAKKCYIYYLQKMIEADKEVGIENIYTVQPTAFTKYDMQAGVTVPMLETMYGNPEFLISVLRGSATAYNQPLWGTYFAMEWYAGHHHEDMLKRKRMLNAYKYAYMAGSSIFCLESGDECIESYGEKHEYDSELCSEIRDNLVKFNEIIKEFPRPEGGPKIKVAFVYGNLDGYYGLHRGSTLWGQIDNPDFGMSDAEASWRLPRDIEQPFRWHEQANYGDKDYSTHIPYGLYDVIPAEVRSDIFSKYDYLIFVGWNSMTEEIYSNLKEYVKKGGRLIMTAAHLNTNTTRTGEYMPINNGDISDLFGCKLSEIYTSKHGSEFARGALDGEILYPGPKDFLKNPVDPNYNFGYARYAETEIVSGSIVAQLNDDFMCRNTKKASIVENKCGKGYTYLFTTVEYPGCHAIYPMYKRFVKIHLNALNSKSDIKVIGNDEVRYAVYANNKIFLLNTATYPASVSLTVNGKENVYALQPGEMKIV